MMRAVESIALAVATLAIAGVSAVAQTAAPDIDACRSSQEYRIEQGVKSADLMRVDAKRVQRLDTPVSGRVQCDESHGRTVN